MAGETDDKVAVAIIRDAQHKFPDLRACSFDKGFHSPANQQDLAKQLDQVVLSRKGKLSQERRAIEHSVMFKQARRHHAAVESAINALEVHGLDQCPDHGIAVFNAMWHWPLWHATSTVSATSSCNKSKRARNDGERRNKVGRINPLRNRFGNRNNHGRRCSGESTQKGQEFARLSPQALGNRLVWQEDNLAQSRIAQNQTDDRAENDPFRADFVVYGDRVSA